jgi:RimJ/RimL family protein N-acetyltransferase
MTDVVLRAVDDADLGQKFWGRGVGTAALQQFLQRERVRPLYADLFAGNTASVRLLERCGFRRVGTERDGDLEVLLLRLDEGAAGESSP